MIYPKSPDTYWSFKHALKFVSKRSISMPLGILTVSTLLPKNWNKKLVDLNVSKLRNKDINWADYIMISAISNQKKSVYQVINRCKQMHKKIIAGGPLFTEEFEEFGEIDHFVLNEAEITLPQFIEDLKNDQPKRIYDSEEFADISKSPIPDYKLVKMNRYATASIQYSRGCPFTCEFCDVTALFGHKIRTKTAYQIIEELNALFNAGYRGSVFFVDDNFTAQKKKLKTILLPALISWMQKNNYPFIFNTEASIEIADDQELLEMLVEAGFSKVFIGIETPEEKSLTECNKIQNKKRDLVHSVQEIQNRGIEVSAGFIVGFDSDPPNIFQRQIDFIQHSGIITAMVGLLNAPRLSKLYERLQKEGRIINAFSGDNTDFSINFKPKMKHEKLISGYQEILRNIYSSKAYYNRVLYFIKNYNPPFKEQRKISFIKLLAFIKSILYIGIWQKNRKYYWYLILWTLFRKPRVFPLAVTYSIYGYHFQKVFRV